MSNKQQSKLDSLAQATIRLKGIDEDGMPKFKKTSQTFTKVEWDSFVSDARNPGFWLVEIQHKPDGFNEPDAKVMQPKSISILEKALEQEDVVEAEEDEKPKRGRQPKK